MQTDTSIIKLGISQIVPNQYQPRKVFDEKALDDLAMSIKTYGIINPILVRKKDDKYEIIAGERRFRAAQKIGLTEVPVIIKNANEQQMAEIALMENIQRQELTAIEEAKSYEEILRIGNETQVSLANKLGKSQSSIANKIRLLSLPEKIQNALAEKKISERHARSLLSVEDEERQLEILNRIITERLTVKETDQIIKEKEVSEEEIKQAISDIMKSLNIKEEEKEDDNMNNGNFFPNNNNQTSLNMMNMQSMPAQQENIMPQSEQPMVAPMPFPQVTPSVVPENPGIMGNESQQYMPVFEPQAQPTMPDFNVAPPALEPTAPQINEAPLFTPELTVTPQPENQEPMTSSFDMPLFNPTAQMPPIEPQISPIMPEFGPLEQPAISETTTPSYEIPVVSPAMEMPQTENKLNKLKDLLNVNGYSYKVYSNETDTCLIIELPKN